MFCRHRFLIYVSAVGRIQCCVTRKVKTVVTSCNAGAVQGLAEQNAESFQQSKLAAYRSPSAHGESQIAIKGIVKETGNSMLMRTCLAKQPDVDGFRAAVEMYKAKNRPRHGHMEFISTALKFIEPYKLQHDVDVYNMLLDIFPRNIFSNNTILDALWPKPHPQINLALDILTRMEWVGLMPNQATVDIVTDVFGRASFPLQKIHRMFFWFEEFKNINPYDLPDEVYADKLVVRTEILKRISGSADGIKVFELSQCKDVDGVLEYERFIIGSQTARQQTWLAACHVEKPLFVEGPFHMWLNKAREEYFVLKTGKGDLCSRKEFAVEPDEEQEGVVLAICLVSRPFVEALQSWIKYLQDVNPKLKDFNIVFNVTESQRIEPVIAIAQT